MMCPNIIVIKKIPSVWIARKACTVVTIIGETLATYQLEQYKYDGQLHTNKTEGLQISRDNISI